MLGLCHEHPGATVAALAALAFPDVDVIGQLLAFSEILAHCDYLVTQDRLRLDEASGVVTPLD